MKFFADTAEIAGYVGWVIDPERRHGEIDTVAVREPARGNGIGRALCEHAMSAMRAQSVEVVELGTGGDDFHAPARAPWRSTCAASEQHSCRDERAVLQA